MANHPSAVKRNRQRIRRTERNRAARSALRSIVKAARAAIAGGNKDTALKSTALAEKALATAAGKGIVPRNRASRVTSRLAQAIAKIA
jgi:small subunit ribosomal protein S20